MGPEGSKESRKKGGQKVALILVRQLRLRQFETVIRQPGSLPSDIPNPLPSDQVQTKHAPHLGEIDFSLVRFIMPGRRLIAVNASRPYRSC
jgi:hypothetical protein